MKMVTRVEMDTTLALAFREQVLPRDAKLSGHRCHFHQHPMWLDRGHLGNR